MKVSKKILKFLSLVTIKQNVLVAAIVRKGRAIIPGGFDCIKKGDSVVVITEGVNTIDELDDIMR